MPAVRRASCAKRAAGGEKRGHLDVPQGFVGKTCRFSIRGARTRDRIPGTRRTQRVRSLARIEAGRQTPPTVGAGERTAGAPP
jgi:hypothetical protein